MSDTRRRRESIARGGRPMICPYCGSADTERTAEFGPFHMSESYACRACKSPFSRIKWGDPPGSKDAATE